MKRKYLTGLQIMQSDMYMGWLRHFFRARRMTPPYMQDAVLRSELRRVSWRRLI